MQRIEDRRAHFWSQVDLRGPDRCWPWKASTKPGGYGQYNINHPDGSQTNIGAHRLAWAMTKNNGRLPGDEKHIRHLCHNPVCCNPAHLELGTAKANGEDRAENPANLKEKVRGTLRRLITKGEVLMNEIEHPEAKELKHPRSRPERRQQVVDGIQQGMTLDEIAGHLGVSRQRIQQIARKAGISTRRVRRDAAMSVVQWLEGKGFKTRLEIHQGLTAAGFPWYAIENAIRSAYNGGLLVKHFGGRYAALKDAATQVKEAA
jgi:hypothetical protein